jgi:hypothetical protein
MASRPAMISWTVCRCTFGPQIAPRYQRFQVSWGDECEQRSRTVLVSEKSRLPTFTLRLSFPFPGCEISCRSRHAFLTVRPSKMNAGMLSISSVSDYFPRWLYETTIRMTYKPDTIEPWFGYTRMAKNLKGKIELDPKVIRALIQWAIWVEGDFIVPRWLFS